MDTFFITGATGNVGREVVKHLLNMGQRVIAAKRGSTKLEEGENLTYRNFDFTNRDTWKSSLQGVTKVFLVRPPHISNIKRDMLPFLKYLKEIGIKQVVFLSVQGVENNKIVPHNKVEFYLKELRIPYTFIRPSFFMQNLTTTHLSEIRDDKLVFVPTGNGRTNFIDVDDIGEISAITLLNDKYINRAYTITGEKSYSNQEVADYLTKGLGTKITFSNPNPLKFIQFNLKRGRKLPMALVMLALYSVVKSGNGDITTTTSEEILQRKTKSLTTFIQENRDLLLGKI